MLSRALAKSNTKSLMNVMSRGVYTKETQPYVFINEYTKVLVQGMTGKHVSKLINLKIVYREHSTPNNLLTTEPKSSVESTRERLEPCISTSQFSVMSLRPRKKPELKLPSSTCHHHLLPMPSSKLLRPRWNLWCASPRVSQLWI
jgi:hypothetical protein